MKILVDTSIWIGFFNKGMHSDLEHYINEDVVVTNDIVLAELIPFIYHAKKN